METHTQQVSGKIRGYVERSSTHKLARACGCKPRSIKCWADFRGKRFAHQSVDAILRCFPEFEGEHGDGLRAESRTRAQQQIGQMELCGPMHQRQLENANLETRVFEALQEVPGMLSRQVAEAVGITQDRAYRLLKSMVDDELVIRTRKSPHRYVLASV